MGAEAAARRRAARPSPAPQGGRRLVIGVGNRWRGDDGVGWEVARRLRRPPPPVEVLTLAGEATELLAAWEGAAAVTLVDAARSGRPPGTIHRFDALRDGVPGRLATTSSHGLGVAEAVALARALGRLPARLVIYAVEGHDFSPGAALSPAVARAAAELTGRLRETAGDTLEDRR